MPIYTYRCNDCDYQFEKRQRMADDPLTECIDCKEGHVRRVVNSVGIVFKGSGFYVTDNRNGNGKGKTATNGSSANGSSANGETSSSENSEKTSAKAESKKEDSKPKAAKESVKAGE